MVNFCLSVDDQCQRRRLNTTDGEYLTILTIAQRIEAGCIHAQQPVPNGTRQSCLIELVEGSLFFQLLEALADCLFRQGGDPQSIHRSTAASFLHDPTLDQFSLLAGISAVDDRFCLTNQCFNRPELLFVGWVGDEFDAKPGRNHR